MKYLLSTLFLFAMLVGCASPPRVYHTGISKHPHVLTLMREGRYQLEHRYMERPAEMGRWAAVLRDSEMEIIQLHPDDPEQKTQYAYLTDPEENLISLWLYDDIQSILINHIPKSTTANHTARQYLYKR